MSITSRGKYDQGMVMERDGLKAEEIAQRLGLAGAQSWYALKYRQRKALDGLNKMAADGAARAANNLEPHGWSSLRPVEDEQPVAVEDEQPLAVEAVAVGSKSMDGGTDWKSQPEVDLVLPDVFVGRAVEAAVRTGMRMQVRTEAQGELLSYCCNGEGIQMRRRGSKDKNIQLSYAQARTVVKEILALLQLYNRA